MLVRNATFADCAAIARLQVNSYRSAYASLMPAEYLAAHRGLVFGDIIFIADPTHRA